MDKNIKLGGRGWSDRPLTDAEAESLVTETAKSLGDGWEGCVSERLTPYLWNPKKQSRVTFSPYLNGVTGYKVEMFTTCGGVHSAYSEVSAQDALDQVKAKLLTTLTEMATFLDIKLPEKG